MRVITGTAKGTRLLTLDGDSVRPSSEKVKEAVFSSIQFELEQSSFLDLFAGSGQMGIEALSRGAKNAVFIDNSFQSISIIKQNLGNCNLSENSIVLKSDFKDYLNNSKSKFDIAFLDPPYHLGLLEEALVLTSKVMNPNGIIICEHPSVVSLPDDINQFSKTKEYRYGKIFITVYRKND